MHPHSWTLTNVTDPVIRLTDFRKMGSNSHQNQFCIFGSLAKERIYMGKADYRIFDDNWALQISKLENG
jgi:hypothetical protein